MFCQNCKVSIPGTSKFCPKCGIKVEPAKDRDGIFCPKCGTENPITAKFCKKDGAPLKWETKPSVALENEVKPEAAVSPALKVAPKVEVKKEEPKRPSKKWIWIAACGVILIFAGVVGYLYFSGQIPKQPNEVTAVQEVTEPPEAVIAPVEVIMDSNLRQKLNTFFSNFSEAFFQPFEKDNIDNNDLIRFGVLHNLINRPDRVNFIGGEQQLEAAYVSRAIERYFGINFQDHRSVPPERRGYFHFIGVRYANGYYYFHGGGGEAITFSQVVELVDIGNNLFEAIVDIYSASNAWGGNPHGTIAEWRRFDPHDIPARTERMKATIKKIHTDRGESYILIEYLRTDDDAKLRVEELRTAPAAKIPVPQPIVDPSILLAKWVPERGEKVHGHHLSTLEFRKDGTLISSMTTSGKWEVKGTDQIELTHGSQFFPGSPVVETHQIDGNTLKDSFGSVLTKDRGARVIRQEARKRIWDRYVSSAEGTKRELTLKDDGIFLSSIFISKRWEADGEIVKVYTPDGKESPWFYEIKGEKLEAHLRDAPEMSFTQLFVRAPR